MSVHVFGSRLSYVRDVQRELSFSTSSMALCSALLAGIPVFTDDPCRFENWRDHSQAGCIGRYQALTGFVLLITFCRWHLWILAPWMHFLIFGGPRNLGLQMCHTWLTVSHLYKWWMWPHRWRWQLRQRYVQLQCKTTTASCFLHMTTTYFKSGCVGREAFGNSQRIWNYATQIHQWTCQVIRRLAWRTGG